MYILSITEGPGEGTVLFKLLNCYVFNKMLINISRLDYQL